MLDDPAVRVLHLSWEHPPVVYGGVAAYVQGLSRAQAAAGHDVTVVTAAGGTPGLGDSPGDGIGRRDDEQGVHVVRVADDPPTLDGAGLVAQVLALGHALTRAALHRVAEVGADVVVAHDWVTAHAAVAVAELRHLPLVACVHATEAGRWSGWVGGPTSTAVHTTERWLVRRAARVVVSSASTAAEVVALFDVEPGRVAVVGQGVEVPAPDAAGPRVVLPPDLAGAVGDDGPLVVVAGRVQHEKGQDVAVDALALLDGQAGRQTRLVLAGTGTASPAVADQVRRLGLGDQVLAPGRLERPALAALLARADVVVVPSRYEPFGRAVLEARAAGRPVVASAVGGLAEQVRDGVDGLLVAADDPAALAAAVRGLLDDPARAARLARAGHEVARRSTWAAAARAVDDVLDQAVADPGPSAPDERVVVPDLDLLAAARATMAR